jgi:hypothetical protein
MKKILLVLSFLFSVHSLFAQSFDFGIRGGLNESTLDYKQIPGNTSSRRAGFNAGIFADLGLGNISIQPGLFYTTKGQNGSYSSSATVDGQTTTVSGIGKVTYNYLELPVNILYNIRTPIGKFFIGGGPYLATGLSAHSVITTTSGSSAPNTTNYPLTFGSNNGDLKRYDYGLGALGGLRLKNGLLFSAGYEHGLTGNTYNTAQSNKQDVISLSVGYTFL